MPDRSACPLVDPSSALLFVINGASGSAADDEVRAAIESALAAADRRGELLFCEPAQVQQQAASAAARAVATRTAVVGVGGDGTLNAVAQAAHDAGAAMGVVPKGTFNYFARTHGIPTDPAEATAALLMAQPQAVQVAGLNQRVFLVNASLGLYPDLLEDREAYKKRFGRSRLVALGSAMATLLRAQRRLRLRIDGPGPSRAVRTLTLFVGNNRLQLEQFGMLPAHETRPGHITAVMLKPIGTLAMLGLMLRGAMGSLGEAESVEHFEFERLVVTPSRLYGRRRVKVAFDGEVAWMPVPIVFKVLARPLWLMKVAPGASA
jgi:diacylglycerol kinase family enzyme